MLKVYIKTVDNANLPSYVQFSSTWQDGVYVALVTEAELTKLQADPHVKLLEYATIRIA